MTAGAGSCQPAAWSSISCSRVFRTAGPAVVCKKESLRQESRRPIWPGVSWWRSLPMWVSTINRHSTSLTVARVSPPVRVTIQHSASKLRRTSFGGTPSYFVKSCNCRRFNKPYISLRNAMKAGHRPGGEVEERSNSPRS